MLVLSRRPNEAIVVGENIVLRVLEIRGGQVRFGVEAPPEVPVHRSEVLAAVQMQPAPARSAAA